MQISNPNIDRTCIEAEIYNGLFDFNNKRILELGCGSAPHARKIAESHPTCHIDACEVDMLQHDKNLNNDAPPNITFKEAGAQDIPADDNTVDIIFMFKSLHHVPINLMDKAMQEIKRVLKPGGMAYISEPIFAGDYNDMMSIFHNEEIVRKHAFAAVKNAVDKGLFQLKDEIFFNTQRKIESFDIFQNEILSKTFVEHKLDDATWEKVKDIFDKNMKEGVAVFTAPHRVDLLDTKTIL